MGPSKHPSIQAPCNSSTACTPVLVLDSGCDLERERCEGEGGREREVCLGNLAPKTTYTPLCLSLADRARSQLFAWRISRISRTSHPQGKHPSSGEDKSTVGSVVFCRTLTWIAKRMHVADGGHPVGERRSWAPKDPACQHGGTSSYIRTHRRPPNAQRPLNLMRTAEVGMTKARGREGPPLHRFVTETTLGRPRRLDSGVVLPSAPVGCAKCA